MEETALHIADRLKSFGQKFNCLLDNFKMLNRSKSDLPTKKCVVCDRPFAWRKKWERVWEQVKYCSERCRRSGIEKQPDQSHASEGES